MAATLEYLVKVQDAELKELRSQLKQTGTQAEETGKSHSKLGGILGDVGKQVVGLAAAYASVEGVKKFYEAGEALRMSQESLDVAIKHTGGDVKVLGPQYDATAKSAAQYGMTQTDATKALAQATLLTGNASKAQKAYQEALVISKATGKDFNSVLIATSKAQDGTVGGLTRYGVQLSSTSSSQQQFNTIMGRFGGQADANTSASEKLRANLSNLEAEIGAKLVPVINSAIDFITKHWPEISAVVTKVGQELSAVFNGVVKPLFENVLIPLFKFAVEWIKANWPQIHATIQQVMDSVKQIIQTVTEIIRQIWSKWGNTIKQIVRDDFDEVKTVIKTAFDIISGLFKILSDVLHGRWGKLWTDLKTMVSQVLHGIWQLISDEVDKIGAVAGAIGKALYNGITGALKGLGTGLAGLIKGAINDVISMIDAFHIHFGGLKVLGHTIIPSLDAHPFNIPLLAEGGIVNQPTLAMVGEAGPEAVIPLNRAQSLTGGETHIHLHIDGKEVTEVVYQGLLKKGLRNSLGLAS